jgi:hypothetical protein
MPNVCFTGAGKRHGVGAFTRIQWRALARSRGWTAQDAVDFSTDYLVASRSDTSKARAARDFGVDVISYARFEALIDTTVDHVTVITSGAGGGGSGPSSVPTNVGSTRPSDEVWQASDGAWVWNGRAFSTRADAQLARNRSSARTPSPPSPSVPLDRSGPWPRVCTNPNLRGLWLTSDGQTWQLPEMAHAHQRRLNTITEPVQPVAARPLNLDVAAPRRPLVLDED